MKVDKMVKMIIISGASFSVSTVGLAAQHLSQLLPTDKINNNTPATVLLALVALSSLITLITGMGLLYKARIADRKMEAELKKELAVIEAEATKAAASATIKEAEAHEHVAVALEGNTRANLELCARMNQRPCLVRDV